MIQYVAQPSVRLTATVLEQKDAPSVAFAAGAPAAPRPSSADASHLAERRDGVLEATQAESVHHRVEGFVAEGVLAASATTVAGGVAPDGSDLATLALHTSIIGSEQSAAVRRMPSG